MTQLHLSHDEYEALVADAADGDMDALAELRQLLKENPQLRSVLGDLNHHVQYYLIELAAGGAIDIRVSLMQTLAEKHEQLLAEGDSLIERMLIDLILSTMLDAAICQMGNSQSHGKESIARRWERRLTCAEARHQSAIRSLVEVRQMLQ
jgi:hypothetical protein